MSELATRYQLRTVRIGSWVTALTLVGLAAYEILPGHGEMNEAVYTGALIVGAVAVAVVAILPWRRLLDGSLGEWALYVWSAGDIALISVAVAATGGGHSELWTLYALTTLFFAASYPPRGQAALLVVTSAFYMSALAWTGWHISAAALMLHFMLGTLIFLMALFLARELRAEMERASDATLRARLAEAQALRSQWFQSLVQDSTDIVTSFDEEGRILYISPAIRNFGYDPDELVGTDVWDLVHPDDLERAVEQVTEQFEGDAEVRPIEYRAKTADGALRHIEGVATNLLDEPTVNAIVVNARDVTDRKIAERLVASQSRVLEQIAAGESLDAVLRRIAEMVEEQAEAQCTITVQDADGARLIVVSSDPRDRDFPAESASWSREVTTADGLSVLGDVCLRFQSSRFATEREQQVADAAANLAAIAIERDFAKSRLAHQARHDTLTGLANRQVFLETLERALTSASGHETIAVLFVDLDGFKDVNHSYGHHVGDQVLIALGHRLAGAMRKRDLIARFGGDEFVALCRVDGPDHALHLAERVLARVQEPLSIGKSRINLDASIGITLANLFEDEGPRWVETGAWVQAATDELLHEADVAMYRAKQTGGGRAEIFSAAPASGPHLRAAGDPE
jgi:diguanylate cyclase (GGDEF)-like protein/PAS domain S-box-containing protein